MGTRLITSVICAGTLVAMPAHAEGWRYPKDIQGMGKISIDPATIGGRIANNKRVVLGVDFGHGKTVTVGGLEKSYIGSNVPLTGDFNGDGFDDLLVRWTAQSNHPGVWTLSLNNGKGKFLAGKGVKFAGSTTAYIGDNVPFVGDFNGDGLDDVGVQWKSGPHAGKWTVSLNDGKNNFLVGKGIKFGGKTKAYVGSNDPIVGDFDGDGYDDIGVRWTAGAHAGQWWMSRNDRAGGFKGGRRATFGGSISAYGGSNQVLVADYDGDGHDDIAVKWTGSGHTGKWAVSVNDGGSTDRWRFAPGRKLSFGSGDAKAYIGKNSGIAGDFNGDGFADVGVHWDGGAAKGKWVVSNNQLRQGVAHTKRSRVHVPILFLNFAGGTKMTNAKAKVMVAEMKHYFDRTSHGRMDVSMRYEIVELPHAADWVGGLPQPNYHPSTGALLNASAFPKVEDYDGYGCRFKHPAKSGKSQIVFKNAKGNLDWTNNANIHRNYCQVAERNYARDALETLASSAPTDFTKLMKWSRAGSAGPTILFAAPGLVGGGNRTFNKSWGGAAWPFSVEGITFRDYMYSNNSPRVSAHEIGHFLGHGQELYAGSGCTANDPAGFLRTYDIMGNQETHFPAMSAVTRWRFGFAQARHLTPADGTVRVSLPLAMGKGGDRSIAVIQPDPSGHPDEVFVVENRGAVSVGSKTYDTVPDGLYIYHVNSKAPTKAQPLIELVSKPASCPSTLVPHQGAYSPTSSPKARFHDGKSAKFSLSKITKSGDTLELTVSFGS